MSKITKYSLSLVLKEADNLLDSVLNSIKSNTNKSYVLLAVFSSVLTYSFVKIISKDYLSFVLFLGSVIGVLFLLRNLVPSDISLKGCLPEDLLDNDYFQGSEGDKLDIEYLNIIIAKYNSDIKEGKLLINQMVGRFNNSVIMLCFSGFIYALFTLLFYFYSESF